MSYARMRHGVATAGVIATLLASVAACSSQSGATALPTDSDKTAEPTSSPLASLAGTSAQALQAAQNALAAYRGAFADWTAVGAIPDRSDYQNPQLADHLTGAALSTVTGAVYINTNVKGGVSHGQPGLLDPTVSGMTPAADPNQVIITDCVSSENWLLFTTDGHLYNDVPGGRAKTQAVVTDIDGTWKVSQLVIETNGTC